MKNRPLLIFLLLIVMAFGAGVVFFNQTLTENRSQARSTSSTENSAVNFWKQKREKKNAPTTNAPVVIYKTNQFHWSQIESADYRKYIANLRAINCPEATIRDIILTDILRLYAARRGQFYNNGRAFKFWETD